LIDDENVAEISLTYNRTFFAERLRNRSQSNVFPILHISIRSGDIRDRTLKWSEIDPNFARFWPPTFLGEGPQILGRNLSNTRTFR